MVPWRVAHLEVQPGFRLKLRFSDGFEGVLDLADFVSSDLSGTVFERLPDESYFRQARIEFGAVTWPGDIDMAPDAMYQDLLQGGGYFCVPPHQRKAA